MEASKESVDDDRNPIFISINFCIIYKSTQTLLSNEPLSICLCTDYRHSNNVDQCFCHQQYVE